MSKSLQDQLLALGLANEKPKKPRKAPGRTSANTGRYPTSRTSTKNRPGPGKQTAGGEVPLDKAYALRNQDEKRQADTARKRKQAEDRKRRQLNKDIKAIVNKHRLNDVTAEIPRHFMYRGRIRKINLTPSQLKALNAGELGIAYVSGGYNLLDPEHVEAVRKLSEDHIPDLASVETEEEKEFPIPDDLSW